MTRLGALVGGSTLLIAAGVAPPVLSVADVIARHEALDGRVVRVRGWLLDECYRFGCAISALRSSRDMALRLGGSSEFDADLVAQQATGHQILIEGRVKRDCFVHPKGDPHYDPNVISVCTDRADQIAEPKLIAVLPN